jgi:purine-binding chemotaxis protein CheW
MPDEKIIIETDEWLDEERAAKAGAIRVLAFSLGGENYCAEIHQIRSVVRIESITRIPGAPDFVIGVTNLRGQILPVIDIRSFFGLAQRKRTEKNRVIVSDVTGSAIGIMADEVKQAMEIEEAAIQPPLATVSEKLAAYTKGQVQVGSDILIMLDLDKALRSEEIERLRKGE